MSLILSKRFEKPRIRRIAVVICALGGLLAAAGVKKEAPADLALTAMDGRKVRLHESLGKPVVLNFWATWCLPCREEMPLMEEAAKVWGGRGVVFIGASLDDNKTRKNIPAFLDEFKITFPVWTGATAGDLARLHLGNAVPDTAFLDSDGVIFARVRGEIRKAELEERLDWVTGDRSRPAPAAMVVHLDK